MTGCLTLAYSTRTCANGDCGFKCVHGRVHAFRKGDDVRVSIAECRLRWHMRGSQYLSTDTPERHKRCWVGSGSCKEIGPGWVGCVVLDSGHRSLPCINTAAAGDLLRTNCKTLPSVADVACWLVNASFTAASSDILSQSCTLHPHKRPTIPLSHVAYTTSCASECL